MLEIILRVKTNICVALDSVHRVSNILIWPSKEFLNPFHKWGNKVSNTNQSCYISLWSCQPMKQGICSPFLFQFQLFVNVTFMKVITLALGYVFPILAHDSSYHTLLVFLISLSACWKCMLSKERAMLSEPLTKCQAQLDI